ISLESLLRGSVLRTSSAIGVPVVTPSYTPLRISTWSASRRAEVWRVLPVARRARSWTKSSGASAIPGGQPSITQPIAGPCDSPKVVTRNRWPKVFNSFPSGSEQAAGRRRRRGGRRCPIPARVRPFADPRVVRDQVVALDHDPAHLPAHAPLLGPTTIWSTCTAR